MDIQSLDAASAISKYEIQLSPHWDFAVAKRQLSPDVDAHVRTILFRPFDKRYVYYEKPMIERGDHRYDLMKHMFHRNLCLITVRRTEVLDMPCHVFCTDDISVLHSTSAKEGNFVFPLYLYPDENNHTGKSLWADEAPSTAPGGRRPNLAPEFIRDFSGRLGLAWVADGKGDHVATFGPEDVFAYIYAILHAPSYRERYAEFLKSDFPRVPLTRDPALFRALCALGDQLVGDHLLERALPVTISYPVGGDNRVEAVRYQEPDAAQGRKGRVYINTEQYFEGVAPEIWDFHIGGYQVAEKWLKDRKGRALSYGDIEHYSKTIAALADTAALMEQVDEVIEEHGGWPLGAATS